jgi:hypothetical protein
VSALNGLNWRALLGGRFLTRFGGAHGFLERHGCVEGFASLIILEREAHTPAEGSQGRGTLNPKPLNSRTEKRQSPTTGVGSRPAEQSSLIEDRIRFIMRNRSFSGLFQVSTVQMAGLKSRDEDDEHEAAQQENASALCTQQSALYLRRRVIEARAPWLPLLPRVRAP